MKYQTFAFTFWRDFWGKIYHLFSRWLFWLLLQLVRHFRIGCRLSFPLISGTQIVECLIEEKVQWLHSKTLRSGLTWIRVITDIPNHRPKCPPIFPISVSMGICSTVSTRSILKFTNGMEISNAQSNFFNYDHKLNRFLLNR